MVSDLSRVGSVAGKGPRLEVVIQLKNLEIKDLRGANSAKLFENGLLLEFIGAKH